MKFKNLRNRERETDSHARGLEISLRPSYSMHFVFESIIRKETGAAKSLMLRPDLLMADVRKMTNCSGHFSRHRTSCP